MTEITTTAPAATAATTAPAPLHWGFVARGQAIIGLSRLLDEYEQARWDHDPRERHLTRDRG